LATLAKKSREGGDVVAAKGIFHEEKEKNWGGKIAGEKIRRWGVFV